MDAQWVPIEYDPFYFTIIISGAGGVGNGSILLRSHAILKHTNYAEIEASSQINTMEVKKNKKY